MAKRVYGDYFFGLDIGTESVGWAATDPSYNLLKFGSKSMWGVRLFPEAQTAASRRLFRIARRRIDRRNQRLALLQELFEPAIKQIDPGFFMRLQEGALHEEDRTIIQSNTLFNDPDFKDKHFHQKYPTIYHLRHALITSADPHDARLVYLAIHHIIKKRGHFLFGGKLDEVPALEEIIKDLTEESFDAYGFVLNTDHVAEIRKCLTDKSLRMTDKQKRLIELFDAKESRPKAFIKAMCGGTVNLHDLFDLPEQDQKEKIKIEFGSDKYEELVPELEELLEDNFYYLDKIKAIHDWAMLENIVGGKTLSAAKVAAYEEHRQDLKVFKRTMKRYFSNDYQKVFHSAEEPNNYASYIGMTKKNGRKVPIDKQCNHADFIKYTGSFIKLMNQEDEDVQYLTERIESGRFMPRAITKANGVIPNQLHYIELRAILNNSALYLPFLSEKDVEGISVSDKIMQILTFRIPYYVGPLNDLNPKAQNKWVVRRTREKIYPWNFDRVVDQEASAVEFITRMTSDCTYLRGEKVLPRNSLLYCRFTVLNELNKLKINGEPVSVTLKQEIFNNLFLHRNKVTRAALLGYLRSKGIQIEEEHISGIDGDFLANMKPMQEMKKLLGEHYSDERAEEIIWLSTIFGEDSDMLRARLKSAFGSELPEDIIKRASFKRFSGWGRMSKKSLTEIKSVNIQTGEIQSIMDMLWDTNNNLMQLLSKDYTFVEEVQKHNASDESKKGFSYRMVDELYLSPSVKRAVWQALKIVEEIKKATEKDPQKMFIEVARGEQKKERKESRKKRLVEIFKNCGEEARDLAATLETKDESDFRRDRLYLYYTQMGKCMYTSEPINLNQLFDENLYDIDHIFPQSKVKDDSLDNRVLVKRQSNADKSDKYPLEENVRKKQRSFWKALLDKSLISQKKYERLTRVTALEAGELLDFIARQLVETRQSTKAVAEILIQLLPKTKVVYVKAGLVSDFRKEFDLLKCREVNDLHHATDAYLNIVVGNAYHTKFTDDPRNFFSQADHRYNLKEFYQWDISRGDYYAWKAGEAGTIGIVKKTIRRYNALVTRMVYEEHGQLFNVQLVKKGLWQLAQSTDRQCYQKLDKYGGYKNVTGSYFMLVEHDEKKKRCRSLIEMPLHLKSAFSCDKDVQKMLSEEKKLVNPRVIVPKIRINALLQIDGFLMNIKARSNEDILYAPAMQLILGYEWEKYIRHIVKFVERSAEYSKRNAGKIIEVKDTDEVNAGKNRALYDVLKDKLSNTLYSVRLSTQANNLEKVKQRFFDLNVADQCYVLKEIMNLFACNRATANLKLLGLAGRAGTITTNRAISRYDSAELIHQSITGLFEHSQDLLK